MSACPTAVFRPALAESLNAWLVPFASEVLRDAPFAVCREDKVTFDGLAMCGQKVGDQIRHGQNVGLSILDIQDR